MKAEIKSLAKVAGGEKAEIAVDLGYIIVDAVTRTKKERETRNERLSKNEYVQCSVFVPVILKNYVDREYHHYISGKKYGIRKIKKNIERSYNVIITGKAGSGKSTALRWIFLNINAKAYDNIIYFNSGMFGNCITINEVLDVISSNIDGQGRCIVFIDGLDELNCITGTTAEFEEIVRFFRKAAVTKENEHIKRHHTFVISTRPEHFEFQKKLKSKKAN